MNDKVIDLKLTTKQAEVVLQGLSKLPLEMSYNVFEIIKKQAIAQVQSSPQEPNSTTSNTNTNTNNIKQMSVPTPLNPEVVEDNIRNMNPNL